MYDVMHCGRAVLHEGAILYTTPALLDLGLELEIECQRVVLGRNWGWWCKVGVSCLLRLCT